MTRTGIIYAAVYGATVTLAAYLLPFAFVAFIAILFAFTILIRVWEWRYRLRHALPRRGWPSRREHDDE
jgi:hypothetical protein